MSRSILVGLVGLNVLVGAYFLVTSDESEVSLEVAQTEMPQMQTLETGPSAPAMQDSPASLPNIASSSTEVPSSNIYPSSNSVTPHPDTPVFAGQEIASESAPETPTHNPGVPKPDALKPGVNRECRVWGPASSAEAFDSLMVALTDTGGLPEIQEIDIQLPPDYLVYVESLPSLNHARQTAAALREVNIDNFVINQEDTGPAVSVGVFSRLNLAERQQKKVAGMGYKVAIKPMEKSQKAYNLVAHVTPESSHYGDSISACLDIAQNP